MTEPELIDRVLYLEDFAFRLAWRIFLAHEVIARWADREKPGRKKDIDVIHPCG